MAQGTATSFAVPNFSGMLFAKGQQATPLDQKSTRLNSSHSDRSRMPSSA